MTSRDIRSTVATSQHTVNYDLPLWNGTDITSWQGNLNDAFNKIDTAMFENKTAMLGYQAIADELENTNSSTVELVEQVNQQLTDINAKYDEVKAGLEAANQQITEANQAILTLQQEDESVKVQMDSMQDDIGKLMQWHTGIEADVSGIGTNLPTVKGGKVTFLGARFSGSIFSVSFHYQPPESGTNVDTLLNENEEYQRLQEFFNFENAVFYSISTLSRATGNNIINADITSSGLNLYPLMENNTIPEGNYNAKAMVIQRGVIIWIGEH